MALLLRMGGVPARVATGFSPGGFRRRQGEWVVRDRDAHSWVEAWFDGIGWVTFDPTPSATPARSLIASISAPAESQASDAADDAATGPRPTRNPAGARRELDQPTAGGSAEDIAGDDGPAPWLYAAAGLALLAVLAALVLWRRGAGEHASSPRPTARSPTSWSRCAGPGGRSRRA